VASGAWRFTLEDPDADMEFIAPWSDNADEWGPGRGGAPASASGAMPVVQG